MADETTETIQTTDAVPEAAVETSAEESQPKVRRPRRRTKKADADQPAENTPEGVAQPAAVACFSYFLIGHIH